MGILLNLCLIAATILFSLTFHGTNLAPMRCYLDDPWNLIKVGIILPYRGNEQWVMPLVHPAIEIAWEKVLADRRYNNLMSRTVVIRTADSECSETVGPLAAINMYINRSAHVFFGPACAYSVAPVARFSYYWGIPLLSAGALVTAFKNKTDYRLLTRVQGTYAKVSEFILNMFNEFSWSNLAVVYHDLKVINYVKQSCYFTIEAVFHDFLAVYKKRAFNKDFDEKSSNTDFESILKLASLEARGP